jgi:hypothetical protein
MEQSIETDIKKRQFFRSKIARNKDQIDELEAELEGRIRMRW